MLDPACGSGNFLYIAYRELKRIEARIYERIGEFASRDAKQRPFGFVTARNFHGMDIQPFAVELAKVTMMLAHKLAIDELHVNDNALPLDNLDANFVIGDALIAPDGSRATWPKADVIIGNPPFLGAKRLKPERGADYVNAVRKLYPEVPGMADYCVYWFRRAHDHLLACTAADPVACDIEFSIGRSEFIGEAKQCWIDLNENLQKNIRDVESSINDAVSDARQAPVWENHSRVGIVFVVPSISKKKKENIDIHLSSFIEQVTKIEDVTVAWVFPRKARYLEPPKDNPEAGSFFPGVLIILVETISHL